VLGLGDIALAWVPLAFSSWQWEFGTIASTTAGLPLASIGIACLMACALVQGPRWLLAILSTTLLLLGLATSACLILFLTDVPLAIRAAQGPAALGVKKAIVKTSMLGVGFVVLYLLAASPASDSSKGAPDFRWPH